MIRWPLLLIAAALAIGPSPASAEAAAAPVNGAMGVPAIVDPFDELLPAAVEPIQQFTAHGGEWTVREGELQTTGGPGPKLVSQAPEFASGQVGVELFFSDRSEGNTGLILKVREAGVGADAFIGYEVALFPAKQRLLIGKHCHNFVALQEVPCEVPINRWISLVVRLTDDSLAVEIDGKLVTECRDSERPLRAGAVGLRPWQREARFRNLWLDAGHGKQALPFEAAPAVGPSELDRAVLPQIAFLTRHPLSSPNAINCDIWQSQPSQPGCGIHVFDPNQPGQPAKTIFSDPKGCIYDMNLSTDAKTLLFSYRKAGERYWHIHRIGIDGHGLQQLTDGPFYDIAPCQLPDGGIVFVSTRRGGYTLCQPGPASNLHRMAEDGSDIRCVSMNTLADFSPQLLPDGRVLFTRWEYVDRDLTFRQSLWTQNPDGTGYQLFFGNTIREVATFWQARPLPGRTDRVVATFAPHHGWPHGAIGLISTRHGPEAPQGIGFAPITREFPHIGDQAFEWSYRDPYPLTDKLFLVAYGGEVNRFRLFLLDWLGNKKLLYDDPSIGCYNPLPLRATAPAPVIAPLAAAADEPFGTFLLVDVYRGLSGIERGRIKSLRVMEQMRKTEDLARRAFDQSPVMSYATYYAKRCWGTFPVEADGSCHFQAPALREIYFQVLDSEGREIQRMTSAAQVMPGQAISCIGCHEPRQEPPPLAHSPIAARKPPHPPVLPADLNDGIVDFPTVVQPVLDRYCVSCHRDADPAGGLLLTGDKTRFFNIAYENLLGRSRSYRQHDMATGEMLPAERAKPKPLVHFYWLLRTPSAVNVPLTTGSFASRLLDYVESDHCGQQIPLADRQRIYLWIDANVPYYGTYAHSRPQSPGRRDLCTDVATGAESAWFARDFLGVYQRACASCHGDFPNPGDPATLWDGRLAWINFSQPKFSPALTAHLAKSAGGRGITTPTDGKRPPVFASPSDADYQQLLKAIETGKQLMLATPEADMPGFKGKRPQ
jgi:mono/diheme cytochrome c family protein